MPPMYFPPPPRPRGPPRPGLFRMGAVGLFLLAATGIFTGVSFLTNGLFYYNHDTYPIWIPIAGALVLFSSLLGMAGFYGQYHHYGSGMGAAAGLYLLIGGILFILLTVTSVQHYGSSYYQTWTTNILQTWGGYIIFGVAPILMGTSNIVSRHHMGMPGLGTTSGVLFIIAGSFIISYVLSFIGFFILTAGSIVAGIHFAKAMVYHPEDMAERPMPEMVAPAYGWSPYQPRPPY